MKQKQNLLRRKAGRKRKHASIHVDAINYNEVLQRGYNISEVVDIVLQHLLSNEGDCVALDIRIKEYERELGVQNKIIEDHSRFVKNAKIAKENIETLLQKLYEDRKESNTRLEYIKLISRLNSIIIASEYKIDVIRVVAKDIIEDIKKQDEYFDLETHISSFKFI